MDNINFLDLIADYCKSIDGEEAATDCEILKKTHIKDGQMIQFRADDVISVAIAYDNGDVYVLYDWQGGYPKSVKEVANYDWVNAQTGGTATMYDGMPIMSPFPFLF